MKPFRFHLATVMIAVAVVALNLALIVGSYDGPGEEHLPLALPTVDLLAAVGFAGLRRRRLRAFAAGFVAFGFLSLIGFLAWVDANPWTFLRYAQPFFDAIERLCFPGFSVLQLPAVYAVLLAASVAPHVIIGLAGGCVMAGGWEIVSRRDENLSIPGCV